MINEKSVLEALSKVVEPDLKKDIVTLNLVSVLKAGNDGVHVEVRVSNPAMHSKKRMEEAVEFALERAFGKDLPVDVEIKPIEKAEETVETRRVLPGVKNIIVVASGKGGVGKSTVAANLAVGLAKNGHSVGMVDADLYGPSMPLMLDVLKEKPSTIDVDGKSYIKPVETYGLKLLSIGFFAEVDQAIIWRGAMATKALNQMFNDTYWGELDYMIIDLPPGTGDIHLSIVQGVPVTGAVIVSTPQEVALADARKGIAMFQMPNIAVPVLGMIENMAWFTPEELPDNKYFIFGEGGAEKLSAEMGIPLLGQVPIVQSIRESGDVGRPAVLQDGTPVSEAFQEIIHRFEELLAFRNRELPPTEKVIVNR